MGPGRLGPLLELGVPRLLPEELLGPRQLRLRLAHRQVRVRMVPTVAQLCPQALGELGLESADFKFNKYYLTKFL